MNADYLAAYILLATTLIGAATAYWKTHPRQKQMRVDSAEAVAALIEGSERVVALQDKTIQDLTRRVAQLEERTAEVIQLRVEVDRLQAALERTIRERDHLQAKVTKLERRIVELEAHERNSI